MDNDGYRIISGFINSLYINIIINSNLKIIIIIKIVIIIMMGFPML